MRVSDNFTIVIHSQLVQGPFMVVRPVGPVAFAADRADPEVTDVAISCTGLSVS